MKIKSSRVSHKKAILISAVIVVAAAVVYTAVAYTQDLPPFGKDTSTLPKNVNLKQSSSEKQAQKRAEQSPKTSKTTNSNTDTPSQPTASPTTGLKQVNVILTSASQNQATIQASGFVSNVVETDGVCTFVFTSGSKTVNKTSSTLPNPSSTACKTVDFPATDLSPGTWSVQLLYKSSQSQGSSNKVDLTVS